MSRKNNRRPKKAARTSLFPNPTQNPEFKTGNDVLQLAYESFPRAVVNSIANAVEEGEADEKIEDIIHSSFMAIHGAEYTELRAEAEITAARKTELQTDVANTLAERRATQDWKPSSADNNELGESERTEVAPRRWVLADKFEVAVLLPALVAVTATSILVTQGNLVASGVAIFVENPLLSWAVSGIAPGFSIGIKSMASQFETDHGKKLFGRALMAAMVISGLTWLCLFSKMYHGLGGGVEIFADEKAAWMDQAFVIAQLLTEILVAAVIFLRLDTIARRYAPECWMRNEKYDALDTRLKSERAELAEAASAHAAKSGLLSQLDAALEVQIAVGLSAAAEFRARFAR
ncbi:hypothetical protein [Roseobacter litoralis]|uniref:Transmembrane protein n=1 Tax=Roseobacter litoralis (strain ATCC 49566 / DSM 6996 / JCM 21268 / NBRC 15278 / OCh 149) TaxID=391595 RepID=F7ZJN3_ROSLO|nr:hypothetical protein [Roseobacter litoralis]AEI93864.1 hypothetical protein RLO149_c018760 [Roseobacter litoralis Och 149]